MKGTPISTLQLEELASMYQDAWLLRYAKKKMPEHFKWKVESLEEDMKELFTAMEQKIPITHEWAIEQIKAKLTGPRHNIKPGDQYKHLMIGILRIEIIQQDDFTGFWTCRQFVGKLYSNRVQLRTSVILEHYQKITI